MAHVFSLINQTTTKAELKSSGVFVHVFLCLILTFTVPSNARGLKDKVAVVRDSESNATILIPANASPQLISIGHLLQSYIRKSSNAELPIRIRPVDYAFEDENMTKIWLGYSVYAKQRGLDLSQLGSDGFVIDVQNDRNIVIAGASDVGTEFGVYHFLESFLGVRWLLPGPDGEHVPKHSSIEVPVRNIQEKPAFISRRITGLRKMEQKRWARRNRVHETIKVRHSLFKLFPVEKYGQDHPENYPIIKGQRIVPKAGKRGGWKKCVLNT